MLLIPDLRVKAQQYILFSHNFFEGKRRRHKICVILGLNVIMLRGTPVYSHRLRSSSVLLIYNRLILPNKLSTPLDRLCTSIYPLILYISPLLPCIILRSHISPYPAIYTFYSLVPSLFSHFPRTLQHIPSTPLYRFCTPIYPRTLLHIPPTPLYRLCTPTYPRTLLHIPSTPLYCLCTPIYPRTLQHIPSTPLYRLYTPIYPLPFYIYPLLPCIVFVLPYIPVPFYIYIPPTLLVFEFPCIPVLFYLHPLLPCIVLTLFYILLAFYVSSLLPFFSLLIIPFMNLQDNGLGSSSVKPRSKRSYHRHSTKLSIKDLALELAKKHVSSIQKLDSTLSTTVNGLKPSFPWQFQFNLSVFCLI